MIKFPSIEQFRNCIKNVAWKTQFVEMGPDDLPIMNRQAPMPVLSYEGTIKLHGTNASVVLEANGITAIQSRNRVLTTNNDNAGFHAFVTSEDIAKAFWNYNQMFANLGYQGAKFVVYGEWCGQGVQKGVAISKLPKMFVIFAVRQFNEGDETGHWIPLPPPPTHSQIKNITDFPTYNIEIDFSNPQLVQNRLGELTNQVEALCPVGDALGVQGTGEGIVWRCIEPDWESSKYWFKVKGEKHSVSKVKTLAAVDVEKLASVDEFCDMAVTVPRLKQGLDYLQEQGLEPSRKTTGQYLSWVLTDVMKEEEDTLIASELTKKDVSSQIGTRARKWYFNYLDNNLIKEIE